MDHKVYKKVVLVIMDGFGVASYSHGNAIGLANPEALNHIVANYPAMTLQASGPLVGLPWGEVGNSEVGHLNLGAGRVVGQDLPRINKAIQDRSFFSNPQFIAATDHVKKYKSKLHLMGLVSPGGVHSLNDHLYALLGLAAEKKIDQVYIHMFTDGRDTNEKAALESLQKLRAKITEIGVGKIATITGRFYAMDRGQHWNQTEQTYQALVNGKGFTADSAEEAILANYNKNIYDEMIPPTVVVEKTDNNTLKPVATIATDDAVIFFNYRSDRALQLTQSFVQPAAVESGAEHTILDNLFFVTMTEYFFGLPVHVAFPTANLRNNLSEVIAQHKLKQLHMAESEKYAHVTSFLNGGRSEAFPGEERIIVTSPNNEKNYVDHPEMAGPQLTDALIEKITKTETNFFVINYASPDMVGHTGNLQAGIKAVQSLDKCLERVMQAVIASNAVLIITADHGNIEEMIDLKTGEINKDHSTSPVPFLLVGQEFQFAKPKTRDYLSLSSRVPQGVISDVAPTILSLLGLPQPPEMNGLNLFKELKKES